ncbi:MAG TPA: MraY family glycosyltransferase [Anaerohalosphaeraceae bacterium]|nr:MraY family glycosyltransferase [Anaerohalosphaeraceae bacterium]HOL88265.1 MraY family glycosyltransferase [Anaerohalosphaeraceae bacterium]HPP56675.1 MraY family glycosyltransferase [Anaerohalosphaeraceae bacterium]
MSLFLLFGILLGILAFGLSAGLTAVVRRLAIRIGFAAYPQADRYHQSVVALGGGIAIFGTLLLLLSAALLFIQFGSSQISRSFPSLVPYIEGFRTKRVDLLLVLACALILHIMGLWDDKKRLGPLSKLTVQILVSAAAATLADIRLEFFIQNRLITIVLSVLWMVILINAFNFLDNMDGVSAGIAAITAAVLLTAAVRSGQVFIGGLAVLLLGSLLGFLVFNFPPATIFMGDAGSLVIGFFVAVLTLRTTYYNPALELSLSAVFMPLVVMAVPLYDFASVVFLRLRQGKSPLIGDTQHFSHRLRRRGLSDRQVALTLYLATLCTSAGAVVLQKTDWIGAVLIFLQTLMVLGVIAVLESSGQMNANSFRERK